MKQLMCSSKLQLQVSVYGHYAVQDNVSHFSTRYRENPLPSS